ncbi:MAG: hypothetical protein ACI9XK_002914 [Granulosicoccus sp.]|jgi:hypothetical protein
MKNLFRERTAVSTVLLLLGIGLLLHTYTLGFADLGGAFSSVFFPRIILAAWIGLSVLSLVLDVIESQKKAQAKWLPVLIIGTSLFLYIQLLPAIGFFASSALLCVVVLLSTGQRRVFDIVLFSTAIPGALVGLFNHLLVMPLPVSPFFWWI